MTKRRFGRSGIQISPLVLGGNVFGWTADKQTSFAILDRFADAGFEAIDTADVYSAWAPGNRGGESEEIVGEWMARRGRRDKTIVVTKVGSEMGPGKKGLSDAYIQKAIEESLRRLRTDYVDVYLSHWPDPSVPYEETLGAYQKLLEAGKAREIGASNLDAAQLRAALDVATSKGLPRYAVLQPEYNLYDRNTFDGPLRVSVLPHQPRAKAPNGGLRHPDAGDPGLRLLRTAAGVGQGGCSNSPRGLCGVRVRSGGSRTMEGPPHAVSRKGNEAGGMATVKAEREVASAARHFSMGSRGAPVYRGVRRRRGLSGRDSALAVPQRRGAPPSRAEIEERINEALRESFPASDPPSWTLGLPHATDR